MCNANSAKFRLADYSQHETDPSQIGFIPEACYRSVNMSFDKSFCDCEPGVAVNDQRMFVFQERRTTTQHLVTKRDIYLS